MKGDFTRDTFDAKKHFNRVLMQQGRVTLDADSNEQTAILLHYLRMLARDLIGPYAAPEVDGGFKLTKPAKPEDAQDGFEISDGRFYVDGILVENGPNEIPVTYVTQPDYVVDPEDDALIKAIKESTDAYFWAYLDVWERHITSIEDDSIREKALGDADTCTRAKVVWQVKLQPTPTLGPTVRDNHIERQKAEVQLKTTTTKAEATKLRNQIAAINAKLAKWCRVPLKELDSISEAMLTARVDPGQVIESPCETSPDAKYRGTENQLYRVEIHREGTAGNATFKWSRDNGSVATAWLGTTGNDLQVACARGFAAGNWIELSHDELELQGKPGVLVKLAKVEGDMLSVDPDPALAADALAWSELLGHPTVRRWDQTETEKIILDDGAVPIEESAPDDPKWIDLEDGIQVCFHWGKDNHYRTGDYWLIPARVATGDIEWPTDAGGESLAQPPRGIRHHYAPLGFVAWKNKKLDITSCRCEFKPSSICIV